MRLGAGIRERLGLDLFGRLLLILLGSVLLLGAVSVTLLLTREEIGRPRTLTFPRLRQIAGVVDLVATADPAGRPAILRAANGADLSARIVDTAPLPPDLRRAPRLEARFHGFSRSDLPTAVYTSAAFKPRPGGGGVEGFVARSVTRLPDGRLLVLATRGGPDPERPRLFGLPASLWMGALAAMVALLALLLTARETRPLRDLVHATRRFNGTAVTVRSAGPGASDIRRASAAVADMQARVVALLGERSLMIGAISHDLRTLLTRMRLRVAALDENGARGGLERDLDGMDAMLGDALAFARGTTASVRTPVDLADIAAAELAEREARDDAATITAELADAPCLGDAHALGRVIANLLDNATKYGRGRIHLTVSSDGGTARLSVEDDGPGIAAEQRDLVLAPYHRGDDPRQRRLAGSGLGLAIVQQIVRAHDGTLAIGESALGGARLTVEIAPDDPTRTRARPREGART